MGMVSLCECEFKMETRPCLAGHLVPVVGACTLEGFASGWAAERMSRRVVMVSNFLSISLSCGLAWWPCSDMHVDVARLHARCRSSIGMLTFLALLALGSMALNSRLRSLWMVSTREEVVAGSAA